MQIIPTDQYKEKNFESLIEFLKYCREQALKDNHFKIASISLEVKHIDPLAVLESIYEPEELHFYLENPKRDEAIAGAESVVEKKCDGSNRFKTIKEFSNEILANSIATGDLELPFSGPHFFCGFTFFDNISENSPYPPALVFLPRWQVSRSKGTYCAVANVRIEPTSDLKIIAQKVWSAHAKFSSFKYTQPEVSNNITDEISYNNLFDEEFLNSVATALTKIEKGNYSKIVLSRAINITKNSSFNPLETLNSMRNIYPACYSFSLANGNSKSFIGATPERLLKVKKNILYTEAVAGSEKRGKSVSEDAKLATELLSSRKNLNEHQLVIDSIQRRLNSIGIDAEIEKNPKLIQLSNVQHLLTPISSKIKNSQHLIDILGVLHPTPAVGGTPRDAALDDIKMLEKFDRGLFAGAIGWFDYRREGEFVVAIRSALIEGKNATAYAGAGIIKGSNPEKEKQETDLKFKAILNALK